ncbi:hypothetical protein C5E06_10185 [Pseudoclavibacter sp. RFBI5]|uniref:hypothetical protein n=1 Tax=Pseudoclavibacter sp. RFBI5 TaxID=2080578 RepID=UPI000CE931BC|nr:hypothetical protein [Pseudoclavibacter sp. RFBI5]PPG02809.1 hypothetical protein C5E06_10185 [Pseudoclavibacter sp. RFBI5]
MPRVQRIILASGLLLTAALALVVVSSQIGMTWYAAPGASGVATKQTAVFEPAIVGTVVTALAALALLAQVLVAARRTVPRWTWAASGAVSVLAVVAAVVVSTADRPVF